MTQQELARVQRQILENLEAGCLTPETAADLLGDDPESVRRALAANPRDVALPPIRWRRALLTFEVRYQAEKDGLDLNSERCRRAAEAVAWALDLGGVTCVTLVRLVLERSTSTGEGEDNAASAD